MSGLERPPISRGFSMGLNTSRCSVQGASKSFDANSLHVINPKVIHSAFLGGIHLLEQISTHELLAAHATLLQCHSHHRPAKYRLVNRCIPVTKHMENVAPSYRDCGPEDIVP